MVLNLPKATLSRDLKFLNAGKISDKQKGYIYFIPNINEYAEDKSFEKNFPFNGFISLKFSNNLGLIRTKAGFANSIASIIDSNMPKEILGTIAGDDTILIIPSERATFYDLKKALINIMPEIEERI